MSSHAALERLLTSELESGFFTHVFVACGLLGQQEPDYQKSMATGPYAPAQVFDLASLTKALATGPLVHQLLVERGFPLHASLAETGVFSNSSWPTRFLELPLSALLGHHSGLPAWWNFWMNHLSGPPQTMTPAERMVRVAEVFERIPRGDPGKDLYSDLGYILLGIWLEKLSGSELSQLFESWKQRIAFPSAAPLAYRPSLKLGTQAFIPSAYCAVRERLLMGEVHDENCASLGGVTGHAGLFGSGEALVHYLQALFASPEGFSYLQRNEELRRSTKHDGLSGLRRGELGSAAKFAGGQSMGHLGFTGTGFWLHLDSGRYAVFLSNRVISGRVASRMGQLRQEVFGYLHELSR